ncbi:MAG: hypothetical protein ACFE9L_03325 [Candidatus Hodarchaeota archaeon]
MREKTKKISSNLKNGLNFVKENKKRAFLYTMFTILFFSLALGPYLFAFIPIFLSALNIDTENPFIEPEIKYVTWKEGSNKSSHADFSVTTVLESVDIKQIQRINVFHRIKAPIVADNQSIIDHDYGSYQLNHEFLQGGKTYLGDIGGYTKTIGYNSYGQVEEFPFDSYTLTYRFYDLRNISIIENEQIFVEIGCKAKGWRIIGFWINLNEEANNKLTISLRISRDLTSSIMEIALPTILLGGICITAIVTDPMAEFLPKNEKEADDINEKIKENKNFRINTSKWLLAIGFANLLFTGTTFPFLTMQSSITITTLIMSCGFYFSSKYQGDPWGDLNLAIGLFAGGTILATGLTTFLYALFGYL